MYLFLVGVGIAQRQGDLAPKRRERGGKQAGKRREIDGKEAGKTRHEWGKYAEMVYKRKAGNGSGSRGVSVDHPHGSSVDGVSVGVGVFSAERKGGRKFHGVCSGLKGDERRGQDLPGREPNHSTLWAFSEDSGNEEVTDAPFMDAVVKVYCTYTEPNFSLPWQKKRQYSSTGR
ncbi:hypothetical protein CBR_g2906 [Chara braunii]|uniref:Uncharacterized protein n=1 Tax=Chara braunii TaxID=69332 RepID=A0A388KE75_CHABU|nr:hypothetical protein CBR_g2906 [Chara braunii]|eukprot:GBG68362.1 hypothetical protein CBR_g2906 [Chara braunii]